MCSDTTGGRRPGQDVHEKRDIIIISYNNIILYNANIQFDKNLFSALFKIACVQEYENL